MTNPPHDHPRSDGTAQEEEKEKATLYKTPSFVFPFLLFLLVLLILLAICNLPSLLTIKGKAGRPMKANRTQAIGHLNGGHHVHTHSFTETWELSLSR
jgi:hypothetical protein